MRTDKGSGSVWNRQTILVYNEVLNPVELIGILGKTVDGILGAGDSASDKGSGWKVAFNTDEEIAQGKEKGDLMVMAHLRMRTMMEGASDTSSSIILAAVQAFCKWPEVQKKAWAEIDAVVGPDRSPTWDDYDRLPYVAATVKEAMRWRPVTPLAFPHCLTQDGKSPGGWS